MLRRIICGIFGHAYRRLANPPWIDAGPNCEFAGCKRCRELFVINHDVGVVLEYWRVAHLYEERAARRANQGGTAT